MLPQHCQAEPARSGMPLRFRRASVSERWLFCVRQGVGYLRSFRSRKISSLKFERQTMRIGERIYLVGSEQFGLSHPLDCSCYLIDGGSALALVDAGLGMGADDILANIAAAGFDPGLLTHIFITHAHLRHLGGSSEIRARTGAQIRVSALG